MFNVKEKQMIFLDKIAQTKSDTETEAEPLKPNAMLPYLRNKIKSLQYLHPTMAVLLH